MAVESPICCSSNVLDQDQDPNGLQVQSTVLWRSWTLTALQPDPSLWLSRGATMWPGAPSECANGTPRGVEYVACCCHVIGSLKTAASTVKWCFFCGLSRIHCVWETEKKSHNAAPESFDEQIHMVHNQCSYSSFIFLAIITPFRDKNA